jgi:hypothetical protein
MGPHGAAWSRMGLHGVAWGRMGRMGRRMGRMGMDLQADPPWHSLPFPSPSHRLPITDWAATPRVPSST